MLDLRANPLEVYKTRGEEVRALLFPKERLIPLRSELKNSVLPSLKPKRGSLFASEKMLKTLLDKITSFSESDLIELLKKREEIKDQKEFAELVLKFKPSN